MIDLKTINENLAKAKEDVAFWERARTVFLDPRINPSLQYNSLNLPMPFPVAPLHRPYGELKRKIEMVLPDTGEAGMTTGELVQLLVGQGYVFLAKVPSIAANEALRSLSEEGNAVNVGMRGISKLWTRGKRKDQETTVVEQEGAR